MNPDNETMTVSIQYCARCQGDHDGLIFVPLLNARDEWKWFSTCPVTGQPILLKKEESDGTSQ